jgi:hypothetical protein
VLVASGKIHDQQFTEQERVMIRLDRVTAEPGSHLCVDGLHPLSALGEIGLPHRVVAFQLRSHTLLSKVMSVHLWQNSFIHSFIQRIAEKVVSRFVVFDNREKKGTTQPHW